jgi:hypothetical protein
MRDYPSMAKPPTRQLALAEPAARAGEDVLVSANEIMERAGISRQTLWRLDKAGVTEPEYIGWVKRYWLNRTLGMVRSRPSVLIRPKAPR